MKRPPMIRASGFLVWTTSVCGSGVSILVIPDV